MSSILFRYGVAILCVVSATLVQVLVDPLLEQSVPLPAFLVAVAASVRYGGEGPALAASLLGYLAINFFLTEPRGALGMATAGDLVVLLMYSATCLLFFRLRQRTAPSSRNSR